MNKFWAVFRISFQQDFAYRSKLVVLRLRNVLQVFLIFFLWDSVFSDPGREVFGYDRAKILTYVFAMLVVRSVVLQAKSFDVAGEIARGDVTNYLLKPLNFLKYCFMRDMANKGLHLIFSVVEVVVLYFLLKPPFFFQANWGYLLGFLAAMVVAVVLFFVVVFSTALVAFWMPETIWPVQFLFISIIAEFLSGAVFPLDIFPMGIQRVLYWTPFPYLVFFPLQVYLGKISIVLVLRGVLVGLGWTAIFYWVVTKAWKAGVAVYRAEGR